MHNDLKQDKIYIGNLLSCYEYFLTDKQLAYMQLYYEEDYSLQEIAEIYHVTRVAIHNQITNAQKKLLDFEKHLQLHYLHAEIIPLLENGYEQKSWDEIACAITKIKENLE